MCTETGARCTSVRQSLRPWQNRGPAREAPTLLISLEYKTLTDIRLTAYIGICLLVTLCVAAGWIFGGREVGTRAAVGLTTAARNIGVALAIATECFPDTAAVTSVIVIAIVQTLLLALIAVMAGRFTRVVASVPGNVLSS